jgi:hypothetical protein
LSPGYGDFLAALSTILKAKLNHLFNEAFLIGLALGAGFGNKRATGDVEAVRRFPDNSGILYSPPDYTTYQLSPAKKATSQM